MEHFAEFLKSVNKFAKKHKTGIPHQNIMIVFAVFLSVKTKRDRKTSSEAFSENSMSVDFVNTVIETQRFLS